VTNRQINAYELEIMYKLIGQAIWHLQYLELALDQFVTIKVDIKVPSSVSEEQAYAMLARNQHNTLGRQSIRLGSIRP
jgi:hypothetical protein